MNTPKNISKSTGVINVDEYKNKFRITITLVVGFIITLISIFTMLYAFKSPEKRLSQFFDVTNAKRYLQIQRKSKGKLKPINLKTSKNHEGIIDIDRLATRFGIKREKSFFKTSLKKHITPKRKKEGVFPADAFVAQKPVVIKPRSKRVVKFSRKSREVVRDEAKSALNSAKSLFNQGKYIKSVEMYRKAIRSTTSLSRQFVIKTAVYGVAKANQKLYDKHKIHKANVLASWKAVVNAYSQNNREYHEALMMIDRIDN